MTDFNECFQKKLLRSVYWFLNIYLSMYNPLNIINKNCRKCQGASNLKQVKVSRVTPSFNNLNYDQPLLQGKGLIRWNWIPIIQAKIWTSEIWISWFVCRNRINFWDLKLRTWRSYWERRDLVKINWWVSMVKKYRNWKNWFKRVIIPSDL